MPDRFAGIKKSFLKAFLLRKRFESSYFNSRRSKNAVIARAFGSAVSCPVCEKLRLNSFSPIRDKELPLGGLVSEGLFGVSSNDILYRRTVAQIALPPNFRKLHSAKCFYKILETAAALDAR